MLAFDYALRGAAGALCHCCLVTNNFRNYVDNAKYLVAFRSWPGALKGTTKEFCGRSTTADPAPTECASFLPWRFIALSGRAGARSCLPPRS